MRTTTGVTKSEKMKAPVKPMRRWLPQIPTRMQNTTYKNTRAIGWDRTAMKPHCDRTDSIDGRFPKLAWRAQFGGVEGGDDLKDFSFSFCALMNSR